MSSTKQAVILILILTVFSSCNDKPIPKPYGYFRIDFPEKIYLNFDQNIVPFQFQYPFYSILIPNHNKKPGQFWFDLNFPSQNAQLHLSYLPINENLRFLLEESHSLAFKHQIKSNAIEDELIMIPDSNKFGIIYHIRGNAASPLQFFITDSTNHFLRGSLYFLHSPNADSIAPVLHFIEKDIYHLIQTLDWKN